MAGFDSREEKEKFTDHLFNTVREGLLVLDKNLRVKKANSSFCNMFQVKPGETEGRMLYELGNNQWDILDLRKLLGEVLPEKKTIKNYQIEHTFQNIGRRVILLNARQLDDVQLILLAFEDATERKQAIREVRKSKDDLEKRVEKQTRQVRKLASRLTKIEEKERTRISDILHDDLQQYLFVIQMNLNSIHQQITSEVSNDQLLQEINEAKELNDRAMKKTRELSSDLNPSVLKSEELNEMINWLIKRFDEMHNLKIYRQAEKDFFIHKEEVRMVLLKILRELLFNIVKHADTNYADIRIDESTNGRMIIHVIDEGSGFDVDKVDDKKDFGLFSVRERLNLIDGNLDIDSAPGRGTHIKITIPKNGNTTAGYTG